MFRRAMAVSLLVALVPTAGMVGAEEATCVDAYRSANASYFNDLAELENARLNAGGGSILGVGLGAACAFAQRSVVGWLGCATAGALIGGPSYGYLLSVNHRIEQLDSSYRMYQVYAFAVDQSQVQPEVVNEFLSDVGLDQQRNSDVLQVFTEKMQNGQFCDLDRKPNALYTDVVRTVREELTQSSVQESVRDQR